MPRQVCVENSTLSLPLLVRGLREKLEIVNKAKIDGAKVKPISTEGRLLSSMLEEDTDFIKMLNSKKDDPVVKYLFRLNHIIYRDFIIPRTEQYIEHYKPNTPMALFAYKNGKPVALVYEFFKVNKLSNNHTVDILSFYLDESKSLFNNTTWFQTYLEGLKSEKIKNRWLNVSRAKQTAKRYKIMSISEYVRTYINTTSLSEKHVREYIKRLENHVIPVQFCKADKIEDYIKMYGSENIGSCMVGSERAWSSFDVEDDEGKKISFTPALFYYRMKDYYDAYFMYKNTRIVARAVVWKKTNRVIRIYSGGGSDLRIFIRHLTEAGVNPEPDRYSFPDKLELKGFKNGKEYVFPYPYLDNVKQAEGYALSLEFKDANKKDTVIIKREDSTKTGNTCVPFLFQGGFIRSTSISSNAKCAVCGKKVKMGSIRGAGNVLPDDTEVCSMSCANRHAPNLVIAFTVDGAQVWMDKEECVPCYELISSGKNLESRILEYCTTLNAGLHRGYCILWDDALREEKFNSREETMGLYLPMSGIEIKDEYQEVTYTAMHRFNFAKLNPDIIKISKEIKPEILVDETTKVQEGLIPEEEEIKEEKTSSSELYNNATSTYGYKIYINSSTQ